MAGLVSTRRSIHACILHRNPATHVRKHGGADRLYAHAYGYMHAHCICEPCTLSFGLAHYVHVREFCVCAYGTLHVRCNPPTPCVCVCVCHRWIDETGGDFDFIADDGGHGNDQMYTSFIILFQHALKPGGVYVIEDLCAARIAGYQGGPWITKTVIIDAIKDWIEGLLTNYFQTMEQKAELAYEIKHKMPPGIKSISCANCACAVVKCFADDPECDYGARVDHSLVNYGKV